MTRQLLITVRFLTGRYHGREWPPSPARLFQAMVAGATAGGRILGWPNARSALIWLENLSPPEIVVPPTEHGLAYKFYCPVNDSDAGRVVALVSQGVPLPEAMRREAMLTQKVVKPRLALPGEDLVVHYIWRFPLGNSLQNERHARHLCALARRLLALGWGIDVVIGNGQLLPEKGALPAGRRYSPSTEDNRQISLKSPVPGSLVDLEQAYEAFRQRMHGPAVNADTRLKVYYPVPYREVGTAQSRLFVPFDLRDANGRWRGFAWEDGMLVASWLRHAARQRFKIEGGPAEHIDTYVCGHQCKGKENMRLSYVPLPSIGHEHADGKHRRVLVVLPFHDTGTSLPAIRRMAGEELVSLAGASMAWLASADLDGVWRHYVTESTTWVSTTPLVLHGLDHDHGRFRPRKAEKLILQAFVESGYQADLIDEYSYQPAPYWSGTGGAHLARVPRHLMPWPRYHVRIVFKSPVKGPVIAGIGRHYGLGVFAAP